MGFVTGDDGSSIEDPGGGDPFEQAVAHPLWALLVLVVFLGLIALVNWVSWRFSRFRVGGGQVELRQGALFRQHRQVRLERVQAVELSRPLLARALGLARVVVQSAGGSDSTLTLSFLDLGRAEALREHLLDLAGRTDEAALRPVDLGPASVPGAVSGPDAVGPPPPHAAPVPVLEVPNGRLFVATILHSSTIVLGALVLFGLLGAGVRSVGPLALAGIPALLPVAIGIAVNRVKELLTHGNFHLAHAGTAVRVQEGLTDLRATTIPFHRIQALELVQPLWWRPLGWWRIRVNVAGAGGAGDGEGQHETTLLPVGTLDDARLVLSVVAPGVPAAAWDAAVLGDGPDPDWRGQTARARWLDPLSWRRNGWADVTVGRAAAHRPAHPPRGRRAARPHPVADPEPGLAGVAPGRGHRARHPRARPGLPGARAPRHRGGRGVPRGGLRAGPVGAPEVGTTARPPCTRPFGVGGLDPAPAGNPRTRKALTP